MIEISLLVLGREISDEFGERFHFGLFHQTKLGDEVIEVFEASVEMCLLTKRDDAVEVTVVNVSVDAEKSFENRLNDSLECLREGNVGVGREDVFVI
jgi:hypothetical protein